MQNLHNATRKRQVRTRLGSSFQHTGVQECCGINLPRGDVSCVSDAKGQEWILQSNFNCKAVCSLGNQAFKIIQALLCLSQSVGGVESHHSSRLRFGFGSCAFSTSAGFFCKWAWAVEKQNGNALNLSLRRILFSPGTATRRPTTSIPHR